ncbi:MAG: hypothetical protein U5K31_09860 [Balneolaceae bacterium]|nr:hypothetical protein [Balneolaceae bacterium]
MDNKFVYADERVGIVILGGNQQVVFQKKLESRALLTNDKWGLNFVQTANGGTSSSYMEFIDQGGNYLGYIPINDDFTTIMDLKQKFYPKHLDDLDQLYYVDYSSGVPVIRVTKIVMEE